jgi:hypothetical protein
MLWTIKAHTFAARLKKKRRASKWSSLTSSHTLACQVNFTLPFKNSAKKKDSKEKDSAAA